MSHLTLSRLKSWVLLRSVRLLYILPFFTRIVRRCPICGGKGEFEHKNKYTRLDRCLTCGHVYARKQPGKRILNLTYGEFDYWFKDRVHQGITEMADPAQWDEYLRARIGVLMESGVLHHNRSYKIFEIGCSEGMLLRELANYGHETSGCEMNRAIAERGERELGTTIVPCMFEDMPVSPHSYDLVLCYHTLEHMNRPIAAFEKIRCMLRSDGAVVVEVPCGKEEYDNTDHVHFFSAESLRRLLDRFFEQTEIIDNAYEDARGVVIGSLYGIGKRPKGSS